MIMISHNKSNSKSKDGWLRMLRATLSTSVRHIITTIILVVLFIGKKDTSSLIIMAPELWMVRNRAVYYY